MYTHVCVCSLPRAIELVAGAVESFAVQFHDSFGNPLHSGGADVTVEIEGVKLMPTIDDSGNGSYSVSLVLTEARQYSMQVRVASVPIEESPYTISVVPGVVASAVAQESLVDVVAGSTSELVLQTLDRHGNTLRHGGNSWQILVTLPHMHARSQAHTHACTHACMCAHR